MNIKKIGGTIFGLTMRRFIMSAVLHFLLILPHKYLFAIIPGNESKAAVFLPAVLGVLWGPAGAVGVAIANFMGDLFAGHDLYTAITGGAANFFQAYIPYKLWYTFQADVRAKHLLHDWRSVLKYIYILFVTSLSTNAMTAMAGESSKLFSGSAVFLRSFADQFESSIVLGIPLLILLSHKSAEPCFPRTRKRQAKTSKQFPYDSLLYLVVLIEAAYILVSEQSGVAVYPVVAFLCWIAMFLLLCVFMLKPVYDWGWAEEITEPVCRPIFARVVLAFILTGCVVAGAIGCMLYGLIQQNMLVNDLHTWRYLYAHSGMAMRIAFFLLLFFLWRIERSVMRPVCVLRNVACAPRETGDAVDPQGNALGEINFALGELSVEAAACSGGLPKTLDATRMQRIFIPDAGALRQVKGYFGVQAFLSPGNGGHYGCYDFFMMGEKQLFFCVLDVMGESHSLLYIALIKTLARKRAREGIGPEELLTHINAELYAGGDAAVSAFIGMAELGSGKIVCASAGNISLAVCRSGKSADWAKIPAGEAMLVRRDLHCDVFQVLLGESDSLFLCANAGEERGMEAVRIALNQCREEKIAEEKLLEAIASRSCHAARTGDITMLFLRRERVRKSKFSVLRRG